MHSVPLKMKLSDLMRSASIRHCAIYCTHLIGGFRLANQTWTSLFDNLKDDDGQAVDQYS
jgi:hypothetical protein